MPPPSRPLLLAPSNLKKKTNNITIVNPTPSRVLRNATEVQIISVESKDDALSGGPWRSAGTRPLALLISSSEHVRLH